MRRRAIQLDLFQKGSSVPKETETVLTRPIEMKDLQITHEGLYLGDVSAFTRGPLTAVESARVMRGFSIARAGAISRLTGQILCVNCLKQHQGNRKRFIGIPLFKAVSRFGSQPGAKFMCSQCRIDFEAHRDECWAR